MPKNICDIYVLRKVLKTHKARVTYRSWDNIQFGEWKTVRFPIWNLTINFYLSVKLGLSSYGAELNDIMIAFRGRNLWVR
jgi:hypothetical protein